MRFRLTAAIALALFLFLLHPLPGEPYDFCTYYTAGLLVNEGNPSGVYDNTTINLRHHKLHPALRIGPYYYSPLFLLPSSLAAHLPFDASIKVNHILTILALAILFVLLAFRLKARWQVTLLALVFLASHVVIAQFIYQNWSVYLVLLLALGWTFMDREKAWPAGLFFAFAIHLKIYLVLLLLPIALTGKRKLLATILISILLLLVVSLPFVGATSYGAFSKVLIRQSHAGALPFFNMVSLQGVTARFLTEPLRWLKPGTEGVHSPLLDTLFFLSFPLLLLLALFTRSRIERSMGLVIIVILLFVPHVWDHMEILLLLILPILSRRAFALLSLLLILTLPYDHMVHYYLQQTLVQNLSSRPLFLLLLYFPLLNILTGLLLVEENLGFRDRWSDEGRAGNRSPVWHPEEKGTLSCTQIRVVST